MIRKTFIIKLAEDCVFSAHAATEGGHESLDRIPGSALLGAAAARLYGDLGLDDAFLVFHSGKLRFGDGLPWNGHSVGWPVPFCWHYRKTERPDQDGRLQSTCLFNFLRGSIPAKNGRECQSKQMRKGYVHPDGFYNKPRHSLRLKTAINPGTGRAAESQLFGYDALERGQRFAAIIEADDDLKTQLEKVTAALQCEVLLGRSRSAEYGRACIYATDLVDAAPPPGELDGNSLTLWLLSDLALCDPHDQPTLTPDSEALHLPGASVEWDKTFLRAKRYSPWNAARHGFDRERLVLSAGSVLTITLPKQPEPSILRRLQQGLGLYREAGLGRVWVNPPLLKTVNPQFATAQSLPPLPNAQAKPTHSLIVWLESQKTDWKTQAEEKATKIAEKYRDAVDQARRAAGVADKVNFAPSKSQWGRVLYAARTMAGHDLFSALFEGDSAIVKRTAEGWNIDIPLAQGGSWLKLADWLKKELPADIESLQAYAHLVRRLGHRVCDDIDRRRG